MKTVVVRLTLVFISLIIISLMFTAQSDAKIDKKSFVGIWLLDEGTGNIAKDTSGNENDGELKNEPKWVIKGKFGGALEFDGKGARILIPSRSGDSLNPETEITIAAWIKRNGTSPGSSDFIVGRMDTGATRTYYLAFWNDKIQMEVSEDGTTGDREYDESASTITDTKWHHVAGAFDGSTIRLYIDGVYDCEESPTGDAEAIHQNDSDVYIGWDKADGRFDFNGLIDEVTILNVALTDKDIKLIMKEGLKVIAAVSHAGKLATAWGRLKTQD